MLEEIIEEEEYVAVLYTGSCEGEQEFCEELLEHLEDLDDDFDEKGIAFIQTDDEDFPLLKHQLTKLTHLKGVGANIFKGLDHRQFNALLIFLNLREDFN